MRCRVQQGQFTDIPFPASILSETCEALLIKKSVDERKETISNVTWGVFHLLVKEGTQSVTVQILL